MGRKPKPDEIFRLGNSLRRFYEFCIKWKEIDWEWAEDPSKIEYRQLNPIVSKLDPNEKSPGVIFQQYISNVEASKALNGDGIPAFSDSDYFKIKSVAGFPSEGFLRKFLNDRCLLDIKELNDSLKGLSYAHRIKLLENLIGECDDVENWVIEKFKFEDKTYNRFIKWCFAPGTEHPSDEVTQFLLTVIESFPKAFLKSTEELIGKLNILKYRIESEAQTMKTFEYSGDSQDLVDLLDALRIKLFIDNAYNSVDEFKAVFTGKPIIKPIKWEGNIYELVQFINIMKKKGSLKDKSNSSLKILNCFINKKEKYYTLNQLYKAHCPGRIKEIKDIIGKNLH